MLCHSPFFGNGGVHPCGNCDPCRTRKKREWTTRLNLEAQLWPQNAFITLTYDDENVPTVKEKRNGQLLDTGFQTLVPKDLQDWLKRLRERISPSKIRFYGVGEYGPKTMRPHYHVILFNFESCRNGQTRKGVSVCCDRCDLVRETWNKGNVYLGEANEQTTAYVSAYVLKKLTSVTDARLEHYGMHPEFSRMSNRPGIGAGAAPYLAKALSERSADKNLKDVPTHIQQNMSKKPLGKYIRKKMRKELGRSEETPEVVKYEVEAEMQILRDAAEANGTSFKEELRKKNRPILKAMKLKYDFHNQVAKERIL